MANINVYTVNKNFAWIHPRLVSSRKPSRHFGFDINWICNIQMFN